MIEENAEDVLLYLFLALTLGAVITFVLSRYLPEFPYTAMIFALGILFAVAFEPIVSHDVMKESLERWDHIPPDLILFIFLPALLFGEAMSLNFHHVKGAIANATLLAGPGAVFTTFAIAGIGNWFLPYGWSWHLCFLFGAILSATDPVAVVALLKKVGAANHLTYMIVGEALINDGAALVLFNLMYRLVQKDAEEPLSPLNIFLYFLEVICISPVVGAAFGFISLYFMSVANRRLKEEDTTVQMAITLSCAYLSFYTAERLLHVSGVLCCCSAALVLARFANPLILKPETLHLIWAAIEWVGNTLIFFLAGIIIAVRTFKYVEVVDLGYIVAAYLMIFVIRAVMIALFYPALRLMGKGCTIKDGVFMTWGGLRGAVSMALALILVQNTEENNTTISVVDSHRVFFIVGGIATLTLTVNATTSGMLLNYLGLKGGRKKAKEGDKGHEGGEEKGLGGKEEILFHYVKKRIRLKAFRLLDSIISKHPDMIDPDQILKSCSILAAGVGTEVGGGRNRSGTLSANIHEVNKKSEIHSSPPPKDVVRTVLVREQSMHYGEGGYGGRGDYHHTLHDTLTHIANVRDRGLSLYMDNKQQYRTRANSFKMTKDELLGQHLVQSYGREANEELMEEIRRAFLNVVKLNYWKQITLGRLPRKSSATLTLLHSIDVALETIHTPGLQDWEHICKERKSLWEEVTTTSHQPFMLSPNTDEKKTPVAGKGMILADRLAGDEEGGNEMLVPEQIEIGEEKGNEKDAKEEEAIQNKGKKVEKSRWEVYSKKLQKYRFNQAVYILVSFIEAHEYAQRKIPFYLGELETIDTPEEALVVQESQELVQQAKVILNHINPTLVRKQLSKQVARWILHMQEDMIETFVKEGIITEAQAEDLFEEVEEDLGRLRQSEWYDILWYQVLTIIHEGCNTILGVFK